MEENHSLFDIGGALKRSNSAPMINAIPSSIATNEFVFSETVSKCNTFERSRRYSTCGVIPGNGVMSTPTKNLLSTRIDQIKHEEFTDRETSHERKIQHNFFMESVCDELSLEGSSQSGQRHQTVYQEPLHVITSVFPHSGSSSPTIVNKQCFSPSLQQNLSLGCISPVPSPTRRHYIRRSVSPIILRHSPLGSLKRKADGNVESGTASSASPSKRFHFWSAPATEAPSPFSDSGRADQSSSLTSARFENGSGSKQRTASSDSDISYQACQLQEESSSNLITHDCTLTQSSSDTLLQQAGCLPSLFH